MFSLLSFEPEHDSASGVKDTVSDGGFVDRNDVNAAAGYNIAGIRRFTRL
jgi:hypothetical protein